MHLFYLYKKLSKKHQELTNFYQLLEGQFEMYLTGVLSLKGTCTRWIDHKITAMGHFIEKFGLYTQHLQYSIDAAKKPKIAQHYKESLQNQLMLNFYYDVHYLLTF